MSAREEVVKCPSAQAGNEAKPGAMTQSGSAQGGRCADPEPDDMELVRRARTGELSAFDELVERHSRPLYCYLWRMCRDSAEAEELAQAAFVRAWEGLVGFRGDASFRTWLYRVATNLCINRTTRRRRTEPLDEKLPARRADEPEQVFRQRALHERLAAAIGALPVDQRSALLLFAYDEMSHIEIAEALGRSAAAVNALIYRARLTVRKALEDLR